MPDDMCNPRERDRICLSKDCVDTASEGASCPAPALEPLWVELRDKVDGRD